MLSSRITANIYWNKTFTWVTICLFKIPFFFLPDEVFHTSVPGRLSLSSASDRCVSLGGQLATVGQLYLAWRAGLHSCAPGWLSDGSVRYTVVWPHPECGGSQPGVHAITPNTTTTDNATALYDAYCYRGIVCFGRTHIYNFIWICTSNIALYHLCIKHDYRKE